MSLVGDGQSFKGRYSEPKRFEWMGARSSEVPPNAFHIVDYNMFRCCGYLDFLKNTNIYKVARNHQAFIMDSDQLAEKSI